MLIIAVHPLPYFDPKFTVWCINLTDRSSFVQVTESLSNVFLALMFLRIIYLIRSVFNYTMFTDLYAKRLW